MKQTRLLNMLIAVTLLQTLALEPAPHPDLERVAASLHQPEQRMMAVDHDQTQNVSMNPPPCILLVDDDNDDPDMQTYYTAALDNLGYGYHVFEVGVGSGNGPTPAEMEGYSIIIWFSGDKWDDSAGPNATDETNLATYLEGGGQLFLSSQDYLSNMGLTSFGQNYLGIGSYTNDSGNATTKYGVAGDPVGDGLGPYPLTNPQDFTEYGDIVGAGAGASVAFQSQTGNDLDVDKDGGSWKTVFFGTSWAPIYYNNASNGEEVLQAIIDWFGGCSACEPVYNADLSWMPLAPTAEEIVTFTGVATGTAPFYYEWDLGDGNTGTGPSVMHAYMTEGDYTVTMTVTNVCGIDTASDIITVLPPPCEPVSIIGVYTATAGCVVTFSTNLAGDPPFYYDWDWGALGSSTQAEPMVDFGTSGTYPYTLTVTNCEDGQTDTAFGDVTVTCELPCEPAEDADFGWTPPTPVAGEDVTFSGSATGTGPITFTWDFDDGSTGTGQVERHSYSDEGTYTVVMTAANCVDQWATATHDVVVSPALVCTDVTGIELTLKTPGILYTDTLVEFSSDITPDDTTKPYGYAVDYGDGTVVTDLGTGDPLTLSHTFNAIGTYEIEVIVWNCEMTPEEAVSDTLGIVIGAAPEFYIYLPIIVRTS